MSVVLEAEEARKREQRMAFLIADLRKATVVECLRMARGERVLTLEEERDAILSWARKVLAEADGLR
jgi:hypothetical protein